MRLPLAHLILLHKHLLTPTAFSATIHHCCIHSVAAVSEGGGGQVE